MPSNTPLTGTCGAALTWQLDEELCELTISGEGPMEDYDPVRTPAPWASRQESIEAVVIGPGVTSVGTGAFCGCEELYELRLSDSLCRIGDGAFEDCMSLTEIVIPREVSAIGQTAFAGCVRLRAITVAPGNLSFKSEDGVLLSASGLTLVRCPEGRAGEYTVPDGVVTIAACAFWECAGLTAITLPDSVRTLGDNAFPGCEKLERINLPEGVKAISRRCFSYCRSLKAITLPESVTSVGDEAFKECELIEELRLPSRVTYLGWQACYLCTNLRELSFPLALTEIGADAFWRCKKLELVIYAGSRADWKKVDGSGMVNDRAKVACMG